MCYLDTGYIDQGPDPPRGFLPLPRPAEKCSAPHIPDVDVIASLFNEIQPYYLMHVLYLSRSSNIQLSRQTETKTPYSRYLAPLC